MQFDKCFFICYHIPYLGNMIPDWVKNFKKKGTEIKKIGCNFYLYEVKSVWDSRLGRARKVTGKYLGVITPQGLIKPKHQRLEDSIKDITVKEFGASFTLSTLCSDIVETVKRHFPYEGKELLVFSAMRFFHSSPMKNVKFYYLDSHFSDLLPDASCSPKRLSELLSSIGRKRGKVVEFLRNFVIGSRHLVIDLTHVFSFSENVVSATMGYNSEREYIPQINLILIFSLDRKEPSFFRIVPGSIRDVSGISLTLKEAGIKGGILVGDKGVYSEKNVNFFEREGINYILPLKRKHSLIDYSPLKVGGRKGFDGYFLFEKRVIWHYEREAGGRRVILFLDERLKVEEEKDFILHIEDGELDIEDFWKREGMFGTIAVITDTRYSAEEVYGLLKSRVEIEVLFDTYKNLLHADRPYLREDRQLEGWMLVNFIALLFYYRFYRILLEKGILKRYTPKDLILHLSRVKKLKVGGGWVLSEIPKKTRKIMEKIGIEFKL